MSYTVSLERWLVVESRATTTNMERGSMKHGRLVGRPGAIGSPKTPRQTASAVAKAMCRLLGFEGKPRCALESTDVTEYDRAGHRSNGHIVPNVVVETGSPLKPLDRRSIKSDNNIDTRLG